LPVNSLLGWVRVQHFQQYFSYIVAVSFIGGGNQSTQRKPPTCHKWLTNLITYQVTDKLDHASSDWQTWSRIKWLTNLITYQVTDKLDHVSSNWQTWSRIKYTLPWTGLELVYLEDKNIHNGEVNQYIWLFCWSILYFNVILKSCLVCINFERLLKV
jgi:hypothetical protein